MENSETDGNIRPSDLSLDTSVCRSRSNNYLAKLIQFVKFKNKIKLKKKKKQQLELDIEQQTGSKLGKEYVKAVYCHPAYLTAEILN